MKTPDKERIVRSLQNSGIEREIVRAVVAAIELAEDNLVGDTTQVVREYGAIPIGILTEK